MEGRALIVLIISFPVLLFSQKPIFPKVDSGYFVSPIRHAIRLSGNFCELRNNHFHAGIDLKSSNGRSGDDILSVADGHISRVKVSRSGYGNTLYIDHDCGLTSVYAHLQNFSSNIDSYVEKEQLAAESFEIDILLDKENFPVEQGEILGTMGNSGFSFGPHLHFELRHTETETPINPLFYKFPVSDSRPPVIENLTINWLDHRSNAMGSQSIQLHQTGSNQKSEPDTIAVPAWRAGLVLGAFDRQDGSSNRNGVYQIKCLVDGHTTFQFTATHCSFNETRQINAHIDFERRYATGSWAHRCYRLPNNTLSLYDSLEKDGIIDLFAEKTRHIEIYVSDLAGNRSDISFYMKRKKEDYHQEPINYHALFEYDRTNFYSTGGLSIIAPLDGIYQDLPLVIAPALEEDGVLREVRVGYPTQVVKEPLKLSLESQRYDQALANKAVLVYLEDRKKKAKSIGGHQTEDGLEFSLPYLGLYSLEYDTAAPVIVPIAWKEEVETGDRLSWRITDNLEVAGQARGLSFDSRLDDKYVIGTFDLKSDRFEIVAREAWPKGRHLLSITATDDKENTSTWHRQIYVR